MLTTRGTLAIAMTHLALARFVRPSADATA